MFTPFLLCCVLLNVAFGLAGHVEVDREWRTNSSLSVRRKGGAPWFTRKTLSGKSIRIRSDIGPATRHTMMDERNQTFRTGFNNDNIQIDVRLLFRNAIAHCRHSHYVNKHRKNRSLSIFIIEISITFMFFASLIYHTAT